MNFTSKITQFCFTVLIGFMLVYAWSVISVGLPEWLVICGACVLLLGAQVVVGLATKA